MSRSSAKACLLFEVPYKTNIIDIVNKIWCIKLKVKERPTDKNFPLLSMHRKPMKFCSHFKPKGLARLQMHDYYLHKNSIHVGM